MIIIRYVIESADSLVQRIAERDEMLLLITASCRLFVCLCVYVYVCNNSGHYTYTHALGLFNNCAIHKMVDAELMVE
jgi:hypothetical protein